MADTQPLAPTDAELLSLNEGEVYFSESPSKYPEAGHGTQYHAGAPGVLAFAREVLAKWGAQPVPAGYALVPVEPTKEMWAAVNRLDDEMAAGGYDGRGCSIEQAWHCLLAAAPQTVVREAFHKDTGCTPGGDINLAERVCGVVERAHGITTNSRKDGP